MNVVRNAGFQDVLSALGQHNHIVMFPTLNHAVEWWPKLSQALTERQGDEYVVTTRTAIISRRTRTALRSWIPYAGEPTQPTDWEQYRRGFWYVDLYRYMQRAGLVRELRWQRIK